MSSLDAPTRSLPRRSANGIRASAGQRATARCGAGTPYALLLTDIQMPEMDGYALASAVRYRADLGATLPIIALTAHAMAEDRDRCLSAGCDDYATKPINAPALLDLCRTWLGKARSAAPP